MSKEQEEDYAREVISILMDDWMKSGTTTWTKYISDLGVRLDDPKTMQKAVDHANKLTLAAS